MLIDWFTVVAQVVNFLILVWLLNRFLYKPILDAIDAREKRIADELEKANTAMAEAQQERADFERKSTSFDHQREAMLKKATQEAEAQRDRLLEVAGEEADALSATRLDQMEAQQQSLCDQITRRTHQEVFALARKTLQDLAAVSLEQSMCDVFVQNLRSLHGDGRKQLAASAQSPKQLIRIRTAFELPSQQRSQIQAAIDEVLSAQVQIKYESVPSLISGIELIIDGKKLAWSVDEYLDTLERDVKSAK